jgi:hypothetical protein
VEVVAEVKIGGQTYSLRDMVQIEPARHPNSRTCLPNLMEAPADWQHGLHGFIVFDKGPLVFRNWESWAEFWAVHGAKYGKDGPDFQWAPPAIDFESQVVAFISAGEQPSPGHDIDLAAIIPGDAKQPLGLLVQETRPGMPWGHPPRDVSCVSLGMMVSPYRFLVVGRDGFDADAAPLVERSLFVDDCLGDGEGVLALGSGRGTEYRVEEEPTVLLLADDRAWKEFWDEHGGPDPAPFVDLPRHVVVAAFTSPAEFSSSVSLIAERPASIPGPLRLTLEKTVYACGTPEDQDLGTPYALLVLPREGIDLRAKPVVVALEERYGCGGVDVTCRPQTGDAGGRAYVRVFLENGETPAAGRTVRLLATPPDPWQEVASKATDARGCVVFDHPGRAGSYMFAMAGDSSCGGALTDPKGWTPGEAWDVHLTDGTEMCGRYG